MYHGFDRDYQHRTGIKEMCAFVKQSCLWVRFFSCSAASFILSAFSSEIFQLLLHNLHYTSSHILQQPGLQNLPELISFCYSNLIIINLFKYPCSTSPKSQAEKVKQDSKLGFACPYQDWWKYLSSTYKLKEKVCFKNTVKYCGQETRL
jgi:hypothetical protein